MDQRNKKKMEFLKLRKGEKEPHELKLRLGEEAPAGAGSLAMKSCVRCHDSSSVRAGKTADWIQLLFQKKTASAKMKKLC